MRKRGLVLLAGIGLGYWALYYSGGTDDIRHSGRYVPRDPASVESDEHNIVHELNLHIMRTSINIFYEHEKRYPVYLKELVEKGYLQGLPDHGNDTWKYNPENGNIQ